MQQDFLQVQSKASRQKGFLQEMQQVVQEETFKDQLRREQELQVSMQWGLRKVVHSTERQDLLQSRILQELLRRGQLESQRRTSLSFSRMLCEKYRHLKPERQTQRFFNRPVNSERVSQEKFRMLEQIEFKLRYSI